MTRSGVHLWLPSAPRFTGRFRESHPLNPDAIDALALCILRSEAPCWYLANMLECASSNQEAKHSRCIVIFNSRLSAEAWTLAGVRRPSNYTGCSKFTQVAAWQIRANRSERFCSDAAQSARVIFRSPGRVPLISAGLVMRGTDCDRHRTAHVHADLACNPKISTIQSQCEPNQ